MPVIDLPRWASELMKPHRYKVLHGGRGGGKSENVARALLIKGMEKPLRILCARELQVSIKESVHHLLADLIEENGIGWFYEVQNAVIKGKNGTEFVFKGLKHNINEIKSFHAVDIAWIEEAANVSKSSWDVLIPTIRKDDSEIWITLNPELAEDETYKRFILNPPESAWVRRINWTDNKWFPNVLKDEMEDLKARSYDDYLHVWEGNCRVMLEGAIYGDEIRKATLDKRITIVPHVSNKGVIAIFDLGHADKTAIWFLQTVGHEFRLIKYYENQFKKIQHYMEYMQTLGFMFDKIVLPHDARYETLNAERTTEAIVRSSFPNATIQVLSRLGITDGIDAARTIFEQCWFDENNCADGLYALRHYRYDVDQDTGKTSQKPLHDENSHGADAFRYLAVSIRLEPSKKAAPLALALNRRTGGWMGS